MCGILGWQVRNREFCDLDINVFKEALNLMNFRGPDNTGISISSNNLIGHKRLKILDISNASNQPYEKVKGKKLVYNGEVYNYKEIEKSLGFNLKQDNQINISDTQVVYELLLRSKEKAINLLDGMFAFGWHDISENTIIIARDCLGQKPLYYYHDSNETIYSSELSSIVHIKKTSKLSAHHFAKFLKNGYYPGESSPFKNIYKLLPGHYLLIKNGTLNKFRYWNDKPGNSSNNLDKIDEGKAVDIFIEKFLESCLKTSRADVPIGIFLSGGIDSSLVYKAYKSLGINIQAFTIGFEDDDFDESKNAKQLISNISDYNELITNPEQVWESFEHISSLIDEPHGDPGLINAFILSKFARNKITVGLTGDGADELFGGYATFQAHSILEKLDLVPRQFLSISRKLINLLNDSDKYMSTTFKLKRFLNGADKEGLFKFLNWLSCEDNSYFAKIFSNKSIEKYVSNGSLDYEVLSSCNIDKDEFKKNDYDSLLNFYQKIFLPGFVCHHTDRASMMNSLEVRSPFLNKEIINFANSLNKKYKYKNNQTKYILRKALKKLGGSEELVQRKKMGFTMPLARWQKSIYKEKLIDLPRKMVNSTEGNLKFDAINRIVLEHINGKKNHYQLIHSMMIFLKWRERNSHFSFSK